jgi:arylsulfatase A-like enzyme
MRRTSTLLAALAVVTLAAGSFVAYTDLKAPPSRPKMNVLLITLDTTRADHLGCYAYPRPTTPRLDGLAAESVVFDDAVSQAAVTPVSHASILTGLEPFHHGLRVLHGLVANRLEDHITTLPEVWKRAGGATAAFVSAYPVSAALGFGQGFDRFDEDFPQAGGEGVVAGDGAVNTERSQRRGDQTTDRALRWLASRGPSQAPFFMWVHYFDPHDAIITPPKETVRAELNSVFRPASTSTADLLRSIYDCEIRFVDSQVGRLLDGVKDGGLWDRTMVVVVADHGEGLGDHNWWSHGILYQEQIHVPLIIRVPGLPGGTRVPSLVRSIDLMPTILQETRIPAGLWPNMDGESLDQALRDGDLAQPRWAYAGSVNMLHYVRPDTLVRSDAKDDKYYCLISGQEKLIYHQLRPAESEFYDLARDPHEQRNLALLRSGGMDSLMAQLKGMNALSPIMPGMTATDLERMEKLKSLGYVD